MSSSTTVLAAKVACASAAVAGVASLGRLAVPHVVSAAGAVVPRVWGVARFRLAPPYLFVTVHLIILVIWKLSDHKHFQQAAAQHKEVDPWPVAAHPAAVPVHAVAAEEAVVKSKDDAEFYLAGDEHDSDFSPPDSGGADSCVTTEESDEDASSAPPSSSVETGRSVAAPPQQDRVLERDLSLPTVDGDDDLDATWNAIMQKTRSAPLPAQQVEQQQSPPRPWARDPSVGAEEMNRRFDDFIQKSRNSFDRR